MTDLTPLIDMVRKETHPYVVVTITEQGILWRAESLAACQVMADIMGNCKVCPREEFIAMLEMIKSERLEKDVQMSSEHIMLTGLTDDEKATPPTEQWAKEVCMMGHGARCCRYLTISPQGWSCEKHSSLGPTLDFRAIVLEVMVAVADNCEGRASN